MGIIEALELRSMQSKEGIGLVFILSSAPWSAVPAPGGYGS